MNGPPLAAFGLGSLLGLEERFQTCVATPAPGSVLEALLEAQAAVAFQPCSVISRSRSWVVYSKSGVS